MCPHGSKLNNQDKKTLEMAKDKTCFDVISCPLGSQSSGRDQ